MFGSHHGIGHTEARVRTGGEHFHLQSVVKNVPVCIGHGHRELCALGTTDPVALHRLDPLGPVQLVEVVEQLLRVVSDLEEPLLEIPLVDEIARTLAGSIRENLLVGRPDASEAEIERACRMAEAWDFIGAQPQGLDTLVGERGATLSGGQKQRLSIARALLKDPPVLILDEATSALDAATEARVQKALKALMAGRTTFIIAHRLSTVRDADEILVFDSGRIVERGSFQALVAQDGRFAELVRTQLSGEPPKTSTA